MDLLDFDAENLYFDEPLDEKAIELIESSAELYGSDEAEFLLLKAYLIEPEHLVVLVALYRYFYYQHRLDDALLIAERIILLVASRLELPDQWQELTEAELGYGVMVSMTLVRFYVQALKGAGYLELRLGDYEAASHRLQKVVELDTSNRLGALELLNMAEERLKQQAVA